MSSQFIQSVQDALEEQENVKAQIQELVKKVDDCARQGNLEISLLHQAQSVEEMQSTITRVISALESTFDKVKPELSKFEAIIPDGQYYKYNDSFKMALQNVIYLKCMQKFLQACSANASAAELNSISIVDVSDVEKCTGLRVAGLTGGQLSQSTDSRFFVSIEDVLHGILSSCNELSRFGTTSVIAKVYWMPVRIQQYLMLVNKNFQLLNLKNDSVRKRYDSLKYDIKKVEEIIYHLKLRQLI
ncbi:hypothetical protein MIR68_001898 [Amoeboaphelidium protococcarum]|nr:hypothetical protein MIR68_001898 [Amoeboaphelidium protococcarum]